MFYILALLVLLALLPLLTFPTISSHSISKCCPIGQLLFSGVFVDMERGTELPKIRVTGKLLCFKWLKGQGMLNEGLNPNCTDSAEVFPDFTETATLVKMGFSFMS